MKLPHACLAVVSLVVGIACGGSLVFWVRQRAPAAPFPNGSAGIRPGAEATKSSEPIAVPAGSASEPDLADLLESGVDESQFAEAGTALPPALAEAALQRIARLGATNPARALQLADRVFGQDERRRAVARAAALEAFGARSGSAAIAWLDQTSASGSSDAASVMRGWAGADLDAAVRFHQAGSAAGILQGAECMDALAGEVHRQRGSVGVVAWIEQFPEPSTGVLAITAGVSQLAGEDPRLAAAWLSGNAQNPAAGDAFRRFAVQYVTERPVESMNWILTLKDSTNYRTAMSAAVAAWGRRNPADVVDWIGTHAPEARNEIVYEAALGMARSDVTSAVMLAGTLEIPERRASTIEKVLVRAGTRDRAQMMALLYSDLLDENQRSIVRRLLGIEG